MKKKKNWTLGILLSCLQSVTALAASSELPQRPRAENFASYSLYLQALFEYQRSLGNAPALPKTATAPQSQAESIDEAIARAGRNPGYIDTSSKPRSTFKSFALNQIPAQDMSSTSVDNALGIFASHTLQQPPQTTARLRPDSDLQLFQDGTVALLQDASNLVWQYQAEQSTNSYAGHITLPEGEADASASATIGDEKGSLDLTLSAKLRSNVYITDRDGLPGTSYGYAGAVALQPLSLQLSNLTSHITTPRNSRGNRYISVLTSSPDPIFVNLSGSRIGAANARSNTALVALSREDVGPISYFAELGDNALLQIAPGMRLNIALDKPDGMRKPFVKLNGSIGDISIGDISLLGRDGSSEDSNGLHVGKVVVSGVNLVNAGLYAQDDKIILDVGSGIRDMSIAMERVALGPGDVFLGDFYTQNMGIAHTRITFSAH